MKKILVAALFVCGFAMASNAQSTPKVDQRQQNQKERIKEGVKSGELTKKEAKHAVKAQKNIKHAENKAKADGVVTPKERAKLDHKQDKASQKIAKNKHDKQDRN
ncbi:MAG: hypothetical protein JNL70_17295 [Saprospiraceae bacterium]|nr:hypothetical protein [Saprospiraceae bacterium]